MADQNNWMEFTRFVPGFDFLKNLTPPGVGAAAPSAPAGFQQWLAPTMDEFEIQKRIDELKVVKFWLEQNTRALEASVQALEVQKGTLATLKSMNAGMQQMSQVFAEGVKQSAQPCANPFAQTAAAAITAAPSAPQKSPPSAQAEAGADALDVRAENLFLQAQAGQWWSALTEQFQAIASKALEDIGKNVAAMQQEPAVATKAAASACQGDTAEAAAAPAKEQATRAAAAPKATPAPSASKAKGSAAAAKKSS